MGNDGTPLFYNPAPMGISIHVPAWGTTSFKTGFSQERIFQSTFPRGERRACNAAAYRFSNFNPRSRVGNDVKSSHHIINRNDFNPRSRVGNDKAELESVKFSSISIHVPAWGTTDKVIRDYYELGDFNPRSRVGNDGNDYL